MTGQNPVMKTETECAFCSESLVLEAEVREGEKLFHLSCYLPYKRRRPVVSTLPEKSRLPVTDRLRLPAGPGDRATSAWR
jgi:hypothetical protein